MVADEPALAVEGLGVRYGALAALDDVSWHVHPGEILGVIGPNGAGKSSCFDAVTHMTRRVGKVMLCGEDVTAVAPSGLAALGLGRAFQQNAFFHALTVIDNMRAVLLGDHPAGLAGAVFRPIATLRREKVARAAARENLLRFGLSEDLHERLPGELSYGAQRLLSIALAFRPGTKVLLLDEPAAGLGGADMNGLVALLKALRADGVAIVVIEHHMDLIMSVADRIVVLDQGRLLATGTPREIRADARVLSAYLGQAA